EEGKKMRLPVLITKRDGKVVESQADKITAAIEKAGNQTGESGVSEAERLTQEVLELIDHYDDYDNLTVERVQDLVEIALLGSKHKATAKAYIIYREKRSQARRPDIF